MRFVADECLDAPIVDQLRVDGHSVEYIAERHSGIDDVDVLALSREMRAVLLTIDKDFGELVFRQKLRHTGILLIRLLGMDALLKAALVSSVVSIHATALENAFSVLTLDSLRIRRGR